MYLLIILLNLVYIFKFIFVQITHSHSPTFKRYISSPESISLPLLVPRHPESLNFTNLSYDLPQMLYVYNRYIHKDIVIDFFFFQTSSITCYKHCSSTCLFQILFVYNEFPQSIILLYSIPFYIYIIIELTSIAFPLFCYYEQN